MRSASDNVFDVFMTDHMQKPVLWNFPCSESGQRPNLEGPLENTLVTGNTHMYIPQESEKNPLSKYDICFLKILLKDAFLEIRKLVIFC